MSTTNLYKGLGVTWSHAIGAIVFPDGVVSPPLCTLLPEDEDEDEETGRGGGWVRSWSATPPLLLSHTPRPPPTPPSLSQSKEPRKTRGERIPSDPEILVVAMREKEGGYG